MAAFFSEKTDTSKSPVGGPSSEIFEAVSVMGDAPKVPLASKTEIKKAPLEAPQVATKSPFLMEAIHENAPLVPTPERTSLPVSPVPPVNVPQGFGQSSPLSFGENAYSGIHETFPKIEKKRTSFLLPGVLLFLFIIGGAALWYFLRYAPAHTKIAEVTPPVEPITTEPVVVKDPPFSLDKPNYLSFDTESITGQELQKKLQTSGERMIVAEVNQPVEFLVTDKNNNPIAFSRFVYLMDLHLPEDLLASLKESFSLFLYNDRGKLSLGFGLTLKSGVAGSNIVKQKEASLPLIFRPFLFQSITIPQKSLFRSGVYNTDSIRFVNLDNEQRTSFDYAIRGDAWFIGTSKDTLRAILDIKR